MRKQRICDLQTAAFLLNATLDVAGLGAGARAFYKGAELLPSIGAGLATRVYGPSVVRTFRPAPTPTAISYGVGMLDHGEVYNFRDVWTSFQGIIPYWGSKLAWDSMQQACN